MLDISGFCKIFIFFGIILIVLGALFMFAGKFPWIGRLPGDVFIKKGNLTFYFPLATSVLLSIILSLVLFLIGRRR